MSGDLPDLRHKRERASFIANLAVGGALIVINIALLTWAVLV